MTISLATPRGPERALPALRQELSIQKGGSAWTGAPTWLLYDGFRNKYFRIDRTTFEILSRWETVSVGELHKRLCSELDEQIDPQEIVDTAEFLFANSLTEALADKNWESYYEQAEAQNFSVLKKILHNYLFFRVPLARPQRFLDACWPFVSPLFTKTSVIIFTLLAMLGLYLVQRQWQVFVTTFLDFLTVEGLFVYAISLVGIKIVHEFGHAFMAKKYGVSVPVIGVAFILLFPILYTDTSGATRLTRKRDRLRIDLAGIFAELALASIATVLWVFLPDGPLRSVAFTTATLSWILSLGVNLNPFMRFDGYYILSDLIGIENLQERGFALARWRLREFLFGLGHKAPEVLPGNWRRLVVLHAWGTWIYRFLLFLGIAILVYAFFVKVIGIFLFVVEILWFILLPVWRELSSWWFMRSEIVKSKRSYITGSCVAAFVLSLVVPWSSKVEVLATMQQDKTATIYSSLAGKIVDHKLSDGAKVNKGDVIMRLESPDLDSEIGISKSRITLFNTRLARANADSAGRSLYQVLKKELESEKKNHEGLLAQKDKLIIRAPITGTMSNIDTSVHSGLWLNGDYKLAVIRPDQKLVLKGLVSQIDIGRLKPGNSGKFIFDNSEYGSAPIKISQINDVALQTIPEPYLADVHGGHIPTVQARGTEEENQALKPRGSWFGVDMELTENEVPQPTQVVAGTAILHGERVSIAERMFARVASVLIREAGI